MNPRHPLLPYALLALVWLGFAAFVFCSVGWLPERVATHFGVDGQPNGWETRGGYVQFILAFGAGAPAFVLATFALIRRGGGWGLNIPHKEFWLAPERRWETFAFVQRKGMWLAALLIALFADVHYFVLAANAQSPVRLPPTFAVWVGGVFLISVIVWGLNFTSHFYRKPL
jgi:hypothetical protein